MHVPVLLWLLLLLLSPSELWANWNEWWTYEGISGPAYWGMFNPEWHLCDRGRRQSPINIDPHTMLFDPLMSPLSVDKNLVRGRLVNTGRLLTFVADNSSESEAGVFVVGGPLAYSYRFWQMLFHHGSVNNSGSEHRIHGQAYPVEIQLYGFNSELYDSIEQAQHSPHGVVAIAIMVKLADKASEQIDKIASCFSQLHYKDSECDLTVSLADLVPSTETFITYDGSMTQPGCWEATCWVILNRPLYMTSRQLEQLQSLVQGTKNETKGFLSNNVRPVQPLHHRTVRTNIQFGTDRQEWCPSLRQNVFYKANPA